jgi:hypothetical protein
MRIAGTNTPTGRRYSSAMGRLLREYELDDMSETARAHILKIMEHFPDVAKWRAKQKNAPDLNHPTTVWTKYSRFASAAHDKRKKRRKTDVQILQATIKELQDRVEEQEQELQSEREKNSGYKAKSRKHGPVDAHYWIRRMLVFTFGETVVEFEKWLDHQIKTNSLTSSDKTGIIAALRNCSLQYERLAQDLIDRGPEFVPPPPNILGIIPDQP